MHQITGLLVALGIFEICRPVFAQNEFISMHKEPRHRLVLEHDTVNLVDLVVPVGDTSLYHVHDMPTFWVVLNDARIELSLIHI